VIADAVRAHSFFPPGFQMAGKRCSNRTNPGLVLRRPGPPLPRPGKHLNPPHRARLRHGIITWHRHGTRPARPKAVSIQASVSRRYVGPGRRLR
jgi:hypothetical protein